ncbi:sulfite exporter TauE/SafE family protein [Mitsuaria sp. GD03876]|uniref:urease accessory protein UreH domain-containing protein n=1 Tax=Mitsuaria sp. GD03876 TaxID=2975399 RepID=UPI00244CDAD4|nr:sulfite exporter TauE/SafE family protein [Mitsuaria sp. GD03876]MDH0866308.1 sulfite exporter TauE/SafE family protein [Mitsuaria sp. GD03876]
MLWLALVGSAFLMGAIGSPHCAAMCVAPCAAVTAGRRSGMALFQAGRVLGYAAGGAAVAASVGGLLRWESTTGALRPVWLALQLAVLAFGVFLLLRAEFPRWLARLWTARAPAAVGIPVGTLGHGAVALTPTRAAASGLAGLAWLAWPCGLLQSALTVAALAEAPWQGAAVMAAFAAGSSPGLLAGPWFLARLGGRRLGGPGVRFATRLSGALLAAGAIWGLGHGAWAQVRAYCG